MPQYFIIHGIQRRSAGAAAMAPKFQEGRFYWELRLTQSACELRTRLQTRLRLQKMRLQLRFGILSNAPVSLVIDIDRKYSCHLLLTAYTGHGNVLDGGSWDWRSDRVSLRSLIVLPYGANSQAFTFPMATSYFNPDRR